MATLAERASSPQTVNTTGAVNDRSREIACRKHRGTSLRRLSATITDCTARPVHWPIGQRVITVLRSDRQTGHHRKLYCPLVEASPISGLELMSGGGSSHWPWRTAHRPTVNGGCG
jgi:hypothetical protein